MTNSTCIQWASLHFFRQFWPSFVHLISSLHSRVSSTFVRLLYCAENCTRMHKLWRAKTSLHMKTHKILFSVQFLLVASIRFILFFRLYIASHHEQFSSYSVLAVCACICAHRGCVCAQKTGILMDEYAITWNESVQIWISFVIATYTDQTSVICFASLLHSFSPSLYASMCVCERACKFECVKFLVAFLRTITAFFGSNNVIELQFQRAWICACNVFTCIRETKFYTFFDTEREEQ